MNYIAKKISLQLATQAVTDEQRNFVVTAILLHTSVLWFSHIAIILSDSCIIRTSCMNIVRCLHSVLVCLATVCVIVLCTWKALWSSSRSHRRYNNGFAFLRFLEICVVAGNKSNCNLVNFCCKLQL